MSDSSGPHANSPLTVARPSGPWWWVVLGAVLLPCVYLPTLGTPFDFIDDGNLVYPAPPLPLAQRLRLGWEKVVANYEDLGPFRPALWLHWEVQAELFDGDPLRWRLARLAWTGLAAAMLLWLMRELGIRPGAALLAAAVAMWNPYRNEIWTSLTLAEGVAMPYALLALVCAVRAARSGRPWPWDLIGVSCVLVALGCKNTFAALVPAQVLLRVAPGGTDWLAGWRRHGRRACLLALTLLLPAGHFLCFKLNWHPGQYEPPGPTLAHLGRFLRSLGGAISLDFLAAGLALSVIALAAARHQHAASPVAGPSAEPPWRAYRGALVAGLALLVGGIGVYLPMGAVSGRYTMPAVWGVDLALAVLFSALIAAPRTRWKPAAYVGLGAGLLAVAVANIGKQDKFAARARLLGEALAWVEREAAAGARVAWVGQSEPSPADAGRADRLCLDVAEGVHFCWHLHARGRRDVLVGVVDDHGQPQPRRELQVLPDCPAIVVTAGPTPPAFLTSAEGPWQVRPFHVPYWGGRRQYDCYIWARY